MFCPRYPLPPLSIPVAKLINRFLPVTTDGEVVHGEGGVARHLPFDLEEGWQGIPDLMFLQGRERLQQDEALASGMARRSVDVELVLLALNELHMCILIYMF